MLLKVCALAPREVIPTLETFIADALGGEFVKTAEVTVSEALEQTSRRQWANERI